MTQSPVANWGEICLEVEQVLSTLSEQRSEITPSSCLLFIEKHCRKRNDRTNLSQLEGEKRKAFSDFQEKKYGRLCYKNCHVHVVFLYTKGFISLSYVNLFIKHILSSNLDFEL